MDTLKSKINKIKKYNIMSLFNVKDILNGFFDRLRNDIICNIDAIDLYKGNNKKAIDHTIYLTKENIKEYLNFSANDLFKNKYNITGFTVIVKSYSDNGQNIVVYSNNNSHIEITEPSLEFQTDYYQIYCSSVVVTGRSIYHNGSMIGIGKDRYHINLTFDKNGNLLENENSYINICTEVEE